MSSHANARQQFHEQLLQVAENKTSAKPELLLDTIITFAPYACFVGSRFPPSRAAEYVDVLQLCIACNLLPALKAPPHDYGVEGWTEIRGVDAEEREFRQQQDVQYWVCLPLLHLLLDNNYSFALKHAVTDPNCDVSMPVRAQATREWLQSLKIHSKGNRALFDALRVSQPTDTSSQRDMLKEQLQNLSVNKQQLVILAKRVQQRRAQKESLCIDKAMQLCGYSAAVYPPLSVLNLLDLVTRPPSVFRASHVHSKEQEQQRLIIVTYLLLDLGLDAAADSVAKRLQIPDMVHSLTRAMCLADQIDVSLSARVEDQCDKIATLLDAQFPVACPGPSTPYVVQLQNVLLYGLGRLGAAAHSFVLRVTVLCFQNLHALEVEQRVLVLRVLLDRRTFPEALSFLREFDDASSFSLHYSLFSWFLEHKCVSTLFELPFTRMEENFLMAQLGDEDEPLYARPRVNALVLLLLKRGKFADAKTLVQSNADCTVPLQLVESSAALWPHLSAPRATSSEERSIAAYYKVEAQAMRAADAQKMKKQSVVTASARMADEDEEVLSLEEKKSESVDIDFGDDDNVIMGDMAPVAVQPQPATPRSMPVTVTSPRVKRSAQKKRREKKTPQPPKPVLPLPSESDDEPMEPESHVVVESTTTRKLRPRATPRKVTSHTSPRKEKVDRRTSPRFQKTPGPKPQAVKPVMLSPPLPGLRAKELQPSLRFSAVRAPVVAVEMPNSRRRIIAEEDDVEPIQEEEKRSKKSKTVRETPPTRRQTRSRMRTPAVKTVRGVTPGKVTAKLLSSAPPVKEVRTTQSKKAVVTQAAAQPDKVAFTPQRVSQRLVKGKKNMTTPAPAESAVPVSRRRSARKAAMMSPQAKKAAETPLRRSARLNKGN